MDKEKNNLLEKVQEISNAYNLPIEAASVPQSPERKNMRRDILEILKEIYKSGVEIQKNLERITQLVNQTLQTLQETRFQQQKKKQT